MARILFKKQVLFVNGWIRFALRVTQKTGNFARTLVAKNAPLSSSPAIDCVKFKRDFFTLLQMPCETQNYLTEPRRVPLDLAQWGSID